MSGQDTTTHHYHCITVYIRHHPASPKVFTLLFVMQAASTQPYQTARLATAPQPDQPLPRPPFAANKNTSALTRPKNPVVSIPWSMRLSTHQRLAHCHEAQLTSCCRPLAHESSTRQRQYGTMVARAMSRSRVWCNLSEKNHHATDLDTHRSGAPPPESFPKFPHGSMP
jgi:hypothetical protein